MVNFFRLVRKQLIQLSMYGRPQLGVNYISNTLDPSNSPCILANSSQGPLFLQDFAKSSQGAANKTTILDSYYHFLFFLFFFCLHHTACETLVPPPGVDRVHGSGITTGPPRNSLITIFLMPQMCSNCGLPSTQM